MNTDPHFSAEKLAKKRVEENPTDLGLRFQLGKCLVANHRFKEAIAELQKARQHSGHRRDALRLLAQSYEAVGLLTESENTKRQMDSEDYKEDDDSEEEGDIGEAGSPSPLKPLSPNDLSAAKKFPCDEE